MGGLPPGAAFVFSACGPASVGFGVPLEAGPRDGVLGAGRAWTEPALAVATVTIGPVGGSVLTVATGGASAFAAAAVGSACSGRRVGAGATGDEAGEAPGPLADAVSVVRTGAPRLGPALAGMIGGGIVVARGCAGRGSC